MKETAVGAPRSFRLLTYLRDAIVDKQFGEGTQMPPERDLATMFEVGRSTVRRVLGQLEREGLVERRHGSGTYVGTSPAKSAGAVTTLCVLVPDAGPALSFGLFRGVEEAAARDGFRVLLSHHDATPEKERLLSGMAESGEVSGYVIFGFDGAFIEGLCRKLTEMGTPFVAVDSRVPGAACDLVTTDNHLAAYEGTTSLIESGHTSIGYIGRYRKTGTGVERLRGYLDALRDHGIEQNDDIIAAYPEGPGDAAGEDAVRFVCQEGATAIFNGTEPLLPMIVRALANAQLTTEAPPALASLHDPFGSTTPDANVVIRQPLRWLGTEAGRLILDRIREKREDRAPAPTRTVLVRPDVVVSSDSVASTPARRKKAAKA